MPIDHLGTRFRVPMTCTTDNHHAETNRRRLRPLDADRAALRSPLLLFAAVAQTKLLTFLVFGLYLASGLGCKGLEVHRA